MANYRETWKALAAETGGEYLEHGRWPKMPLIRWNDGEREIVVEIIQSNGKLDTRGKAVLLNGTPFDFEAWFRSVFTMLGGLFGRNGIPAGNHDFDRRIIICGNDPVRIKNLFSHAGIRDNLLRRKKMHRFYLKQIEGLEKKSGGPVWMLIYWELGIQKEKEHVLEIYELIRETMQVIDR